MDQDIKIPVIAGEDLSGAQYAAVEIDGTVAAEDFVARGLLQNKPRSGEDASLLVAGRSKFKAGGTIAAGGRMTITTSGVCTAATSGSAGIIGFSLTAAASGDVTEGVFNFVNH
jgi:hypothetical protein